MTPFEKILNPIKEKLEPLIQPVKDLVQQQTSAWLMGAMGVVILLDVVFILLPILQPLFKTSTQVSTLKKEIKEVKSDKKEEGSLRTKLDNSKAELAAQEKVLARGDISLYLQSLSTIAKDTGVHIRSIKPIAPPAVIDDSPEAKEMKKDDFYEGAYFGISASSGYHEFGRFLAKIENNPTFIKVIRMSITGVPESPRLHDFQMTVKMIRKLAE